MNIWDLVLDMGIASLLLLLAKVIRVRVRFIQQMFIPVSMIAGLLGLLLGPYALDVLPWSESFTAYAGVLITVIFAAVGLATQFPGPREVLGRAGSLWAFNQTVTVGQWCVGLVVGALMAATFWPELNAGFGLIMPAGFMGGHGTAVAIGESFRQLGWQDATTLALSSATFGIFAAIFLGMGLLNYGVQRGWLKGLPRFSEMDSELRCGLVKEDKRRVLAREGISSISVDVFAIHTAIVLVVTALAYLMSLSLSSLHDMVSVPKFACAFLIGCIARVFLQKAGAARFLDDGIFNHAAGASTDFLIVFGIASIQIAVLITYAVPMALLMAAGLITCLFMVLVVAPRMLGAEWFEKGIFSWGWMTGTVAMGILLLRVADPEMKSKVLDDYAIAYVPGAVVDILLISLMPMLVMSGYGWQALAGMLVYIAVVQLLARLFRGSSATAGSEAVSRS